MQNGATASCHRGEKCPGKTGKGCGTRAVIGVIADGAVSLCVAGHKTNEDNERAKSEKGAMTMMSVLPKGFARHRCNAVCWSNEKRQSTAGYLGNGTREDGSEACGNFENQ